jgi:hypothetical protein
VYPAGPEPMMTTLAWMGAGMGQIPLLREFGQGLSGRRPERHRDGAESVKSKSRISGELCKNCNPWRRIFPADAINDAAHAQ